MKNKCILSLIEESSRMVIEMALKIEKSATGFFMTIFFYYLDYKPEGNPFERIIPLILAYILVQFGRKKV